MLNIIPTDNELDEIFNNLKSQNINNTNNKFSPYTKDFYYENNTNFVSKHKFYHILTKIEFSRKSDKNYK